MATEQTATTILISDILITGACDHENNMARRMDKWGLWEHCPACGLVRVVPSPALLAQLSEQADGLERYRAIADQEERLDACERRAEAERW